MPGTVVRAPRVGESPAALECKLLDIQELGDGAVHLIIGEVVHITVDSTLLTDGILDYTRARPVGRLARSGYSYTREFFSMPRPTYQGLLDSGATPRRRTED